jgi:hypothetical protein
MQSGSNTINDYHLGTPDTFAATSGSAYFGFSAFGTDVPTGTWGTGSTCTGAGNTAVATLKYLGFATTTQQIATRSATTTYAGSASTVCFVAQQNNYFIPSGVYTATITATAVTL